MSTQTIYQRIREYAEKFPDHIALVEPDQSFLSYTELIRHSSNIAAYLSANQISSGSRVAVLAPKNIETICVLLAIVQCGACYIPLDPNAPAPRTQALLADIAPHALIAAPDAFPSNIPCQFRNGIATSVTNNLGISFFSETKSETEIAQILYTSGSTGTPKGVCLSTQNIVHFTNWALHYFSFNAQSKFTSIAPLHFDLSTLDIWVGLNTGAQILLLDESTGKNARLLADCLRRWNPEVVYATPSTWRILKEFGNVQASDFSSLTHFLFAGEIFEPRYLHAWINMLPKARFYNLYGPTETNVCTVYEVEQPIDQERQLPYPIGKTIAGLEHRIIWIDNANQGELYIAGPSVCSGYWNQAEKTNQVFDFSDGKKWYKTGDLVCEENGELIFLGRIDRMIKKRGYRIEPAEIEQCLSRHPSILEVAVFAEKTDDDFPILCACIATGKQNIPDLADIKHFLALRLPAYMIPEKFIFSETLPKNSNGKIDFYKLRNHS
ncbi:MAG: amino acid adenylation domain-containing protein [Bacteroidia bacterium]